MDSDIKKIAKQLQFKKATKKKIKYEYASTIEDLKPKSFTICNQDGTPIVTKLAGQIETKNTANKGDIVISGPFGETYVMSVIKFIQLYDVNKAVATPRQDMTRMIAEVPKSILKSPITFKSPWNEDMILNPGDFLVRDGPNNKNGFYRIERSTFLKTYTFI